MRQKIYLFGIFNLLLIFTGVIFKLIHWPGAGIMMTLGIAVFVLGFVPASLINHYRARGNRQNLLLYLVTGAACFVIYTAMLFKIQHWPFAGAAITIAIPFPYVVFLPAFIAVTSRDKNFNIYNTVFILLLLALSSVMAALLALNVSRERINDSFNLSRDYYNTTEILGGFPTGLNQGTIADRIDQVIKTVDDYRSAILVQAGISSEQWEKSPVTIRQPDARQVTTEALFKDRSSPGNKLEKELESLGEEIAKSNELKELAALIYQLSDLGETRDPYSSWSLRNFTATNLSWSLIYLDALKANLLILKTSCF
jgi:hypothetical protein